MLYNKIFDNSLSLKFRYSNKKLYIICQTLGYLLSLPSCLREKIKQFRRTVNKKVMLPIV